MISRAAVCFFSFVESAERAVSTVSVGGVDLVFGVLGEHHKRLPAIKAAHIIFLFIGPQ